jgi:hypothetical protein
MAVLNHHIVAAHNSEETAAYLAELLGLPAPIRLGHFVALAVSDDTTLDFLDARGSFDKLHYAFLVTEAEFDEIFGRITERGIPYWADPFHHEPDQINHWDDGRGVYFDDPNGHHLEILTRPYGSGGTEAEHPNPLLGQARGR